MSLNLGRGALNNVAHLVDAVENSIRPVEQRRVAAAVENEGRQRGVRTARSHTLAVEICQDGVDGEVAGFEGVACGLGVVGLGERVGRRRRG